MKAKIDHVGLYRAIPFRPERDGDFDFAVALPDMREDATEDAVQPQDRLRPQLPAEAFAEAACTNSIPWLPST